MFGNQTLYRLAPLAFLVAAASACSSDKPTAIAALDVVSGAGQAVTTEPSDPTTLKVRVLGETANGDPGVPVDWSVVSGTGTLSATETTTDDDGYATVVFTSAQAGEAQVQASVPGYTLVDLTVNVLPQAAGN